MPRITFRSCCIIIGLMLIGGCRGTVQLGIEQTPTPDRSIPATLTALREENSQLATRVAEQAASLPSTLELGQLAYVQGGDIWFMPLLEETPHPRRLTTDGYNREPRWSPSGKWLAFRKERPVTLVAPPGPPGGDLSMTRRQVWVIQADGNGEHPLNQGLSVEAFVWSPKGDRVAYTTSAGGLNIINADGTNPVTLIAEDTSVPLGEKQVGPIFWSPDGKWIAYERRIQPASRSTVYQGLWMVSAEGGEPIELYNSGTPEKSEVALVGWSALGDRILFVQDLFDSSSDTSLADGGQLYSIRAHTVLTKETTADLVGGDGILPYTDFVVPNPPSPIWQGRQDVAFVAGQGHSTWSNKRIQSVGQYITPQDVAVISPVWSPQGNQLAYVAMPDRGELTSGDSTALMQRRLWIANAFGVPQPRALTNSSDYRDEHPQWSADGNYLLFARLDAKGRASLWIISANGGSTRQVANELTPAPDPLESFGHITWSNYYDWWPGP